MLHVPTLSTIKKYRKLFKSCSNISFVCNVFGIVCNKKKLFRMNIFSSRPRKANISRLEKNTVQYYHWSENTVCPVVLIDYNKG